MDVLAAAGTAASAVRGKDRAVPATCGASARCRSHRSTCSADPQIASRTGLAWPARSAGRVLSRPRPVRCASAIRPAIAGAAWSLRRPSNVARSSAAVPVGGGCRHHTPASCSLPARPATCPAVAASERPSTTTLNGSRPYGPGTSRATVGRSAEDDPGPRMTAPLRLSSMAENASPASGAEPPAPAGALLDVLVGFAGQLRGLGLDLCIVELSDALRAVQNADLLDRGRLRRLLMITMVKRSADLAPLEADFDLSIPAGITICVRYTWRPRPVS